MYDTILESILNMDDDSSIAEEGVLSNFKERISGIFAKIAAKFREWGEKLKNAVARVQATAAKADSRVKPLVQAVDILMAKCMKGFAAISAGATVASRDAAISEIEDAIEKVESIKSGLDNLPEESRTFGKMGISAASAAFTTWSGRLNALAEKARQLKESDKEALGARAEQLGGGAKIHGVINRAANLISNAGSTLMACSRKGYEKAKAGDAADFEKDEKRIHDQRQKELNAAFKNVPKEKGATKGDKENAKKVQAAKKAMEEGRASNAGSNSSAPSWKDWEKSGAASMRADKRAAKAAAKAAKKAAKNPATDSYVESDNTDLQYVVENMIAAISYATGLGYEPEDEIGYAVESNLALAGMDAVDFDVDI